MRVEREKLIELYNKSTGKTGKRNEILQSVMREERGERGRRRKTLQQLINLTFYCQFAFKSLEGPAIATKNGSLILV